MQWEDEGYLVSKNNYKENSLIVVFFTKNHGCVHGIIYGGTSRKVKNYLQIGNKMYLLYNYKNENYIGYFKSEIFNPIAAKFFDDEIKITAILSATSLIKRLLVENQSYLEIFDYFEKFVLNLGKNNWLSYYIEFEFALIQKLGYGIDFSSKLDSEIPNFFKNNNFRNLNIEDLKKALLFNKKLIINNYLQINNFQMPINRIILEKYLS